MIKEFKNFSGNKVLSFFVFNPNKEVHINGLVRELNVGASTIKYYCDALLKENILVSREMGNQRIFFLNNNYFFVKEIKKIIGLAYLREKGLEKIVNDGVYSFAVYGSFTNGEFREESDLDLIVIGKKEDIDFRFLTKFEKSIKRKIQLTIYDWVNWRKMEKSKEPFVEAVQKKHVLIKGDNL